MKIICVALLLCLFLWGGNGSESGRKRSNRKERDNSQNNCLETCADRNKCPSVSALAMTTRLVNEQCRQCVFEDCGYLLESAANASTTDIELCKADSYIDCDGCPPMNAQLQRYMAICQTCLRKCMSKQDRRSERRRGGGYRRFKPHRAVFTAFRCTRSCRNPDICPTRQEVRIQMTTALQQCRECVIETCGPFDQSIRTDIEDCITEAHQDCAECAVRTHEQQMKMRSCKRCARNCAPSRDGGNKPKTPMRHPFRMMSCLERCQSPSTCPSSNEMMDRLAGQPASCRKCIAYECGNDSFTAHNKSGVLDCVLQMRVGCVDCQAMTLQEQRRVKGCMSCIKRCSRGSSGYASSVKKMGYRRPRPFRQLSCILSCESPTKCISPEQRRTIMGMTTPSCRECLVEKCGEINAQNSIGMTDCVLQQRLKRLCNSCAPYSTRQRTRLRNCFSCIRGCSIHASLKGSRKPKRKHPHRPAGLYFCMTSCNAAHVCPTRGVSTRRSRQLPQACTDCIMRLCASVNESDVNQMDDCVRAAREECSACPTVSMEAQERSRECRSCIQRCNSEFFRRRRIRRPRNDIFKTLGCMDNCRSPKQCFVANELRAQAMNTEMECRQCIQEECGDFNRRDRRELGECIFDALDNCERCPTLTDQNQRRRRKCKSCIRKCIPSRGRIQKPVSPRRPLQVLSCMQECESDNSCPSRADFMNRFQSTPETCKTCVTNLCASFAEADVGSLADCVDEAREECSDCPDSTAIERRQMRTCQSCIQTCVLSNRSESNCNAQPSAGRNTENQRRQPHGQGPP